MKIKLGDRVTMADHWNECNRDVTVLHIPGNGTVVVEDEDGHPWWPDESDLFPLGESPFA